MDAAAEKKAKQASETTTAMEAAGAAHLAQTSAESAADDQSPLDAFADPVDDNDSPADDPTVGADIAAVDGAGSVPRLSSVDLGGAEDGGAPDDEPEEKSA
jgi:hypothetical protein